MMVYAVCCKGVMMVSDRFFNLATWARLQKDGTLSVAQADLTADSPYYVPTPEDAVRATTLLSGQVS